MVFPLVGATIAFSWICPVIAMDRVQPYGTRCGKEKNEQSV